MINSFPSVYQIGHSAIPNLFDGEVIVQEKVDGSQFSWSITSGLLEARSKNQQIILDAAPDMFKHAVATIKELETLLHPDWVYRAEYLGKPKHNTMAYARVPKQNLILYDISEGPENYLLYEAVVTEAERLGLEVVPQYYRGELRDLGLLKGFLDRESILGGCKVEGVVVKNYAVYTREKKVAMGKYVQADFVEKNSKDFRSRNPTQSDIAQTLIDLYRNEARWRKAIQHLREQGKLERSPRDIGLLMREVPDDVLEECESEIKDALFEHFWKQIQRGITAGLPEFYKEELARSAFTEQASEP